MAKTSKVIEVKNLCKAYKQKGKFIKAVDNISFNVKKGEMFGLLGANGAGKTTTINILAGLLKKDRGNIKILGKQFESNEEYIKSNMNIGSAYTWLTGIMTVRQNLIVYGGLYGVKDVERKIDELLKLLDIEDIQNKKVYTLSTGQIIRLILCKTLLNNPPILLLDECTVGLDPDIAQRTRRILKEFQKKHGTTIIFTSHNMLEVETLCDRIAIMYKGKMIMEGTPKKIRGLAKTKTIKIDAIGPKPLKKVIEKFNVEVLYSKKDTIVFNAPKKIKLPPIINALIMEKFDIIDISVRKPSLEDVFIKITRGKRNEMA